MFKENLRRILDSRKKTIVEYSNFIDVNVDTVGKNWLKGKSEPKYSQLIKSSEYFQVPVSYWFTGTLDDADIKNTDSYKELKDRYNELLEVHNEHKDKFLTMYSRLTELQQELISSMNMDVERIEDYVYNNYGFHFKDLAKMKK